MTILWKATRFSISMKIWGYELAGEASEFSAMVAENRDGKFDYHIFWDMDLPEILRYERHHYGLLQPPKWAWALRWLAIKPNPFVYI